MRYEKLTLAGFQRRLSQHRYDTITAARRAIGKTHWTADDKQHAHDLVNRAFDPQARVARSTTPRTTVGRPIPPSRIQHHRDATLWYRCDVRVRNAKDLVAVLNAVKESVVVLERGAAMSAFVQHEYLQATQILGKLVRLVHLATGSYARQTVIDVEGVDLEVQTPTLPKAAPSMDESPRRPRRRIVDVAAVRAPSRAPGPPR